MTTEQWYGYKIKAKRPTRTIPQGALFRCRCGGWVIHDRTASVMRGHRADSCDTCNRVQ